MSRGCNPATPVLSLALPLLVVPRAPGIHGAATGKRGTRYGGTPDLVGCRDRIPGRPRHRQDPPREEQELTRICRGRPIMRCGDLRWPDVRARLVRSGLTVLLAVGGVLGAQSVADAVPSFARQTGLPCAACHSNFPELTPLGRQFKMLGYEFAPAPPSLKQFSAMSVSSFTHTDAGQP